MLAIPTASLAESVSPASATESAAPEPTATAPTPTPAPSQTTVPHTYVRFAEADLLLGERTANAADPHLTGPTTNRLRATAEFKSFAHNDNFLELEYRRFDANHPAGLVTQPLTQTPKFVPAARYSEQDILINNGIIGVGHTYLATSTFLHTSNDGNPNLHATFGLGVERLPDPSKNASLYFSYYYYPELTGKLTVPPGVAGAHLRYKLENYTFGGALTVPNTRVLLTAGFIADHYLRKENAPSDATDFSPQLGIGYHF
jgi:hypothetical protein